MQQASKVPRSVEFVLQMPAEVPQTRAQLDALHMRRNELRSQLSALAERRQQLLSQLATGDASARGVAERRLRELDDRTSRIDRLVLEIDDAISAGIARGLASEPAVEAAPALPSVTLVPPPLAPGIEMERVALLLAGEALLFVLLGTLMYRRLVSRMRRFAGGTDPVKIEQLQQAVDVIAVEVERIAEGQRFVARALNEKLQVGAGEAQPVGANVRVPEPAARSSG